jgi:hypothetical protein
MNPVFRRTANVEYFFSLQFPVWLRYMGMSVAILLALLMLVTNPQFLLFFILIIPMSIFVVLLVVPGLLIIGSNLLGAFWASVVSMSLVRERERGTYDLLCLLPDGMLGVNWAIGSGCMHRGAFFDLLQLGVRTLALLSLVILGVMFIIAIGIAAGLSFQDTNDDLLRAIRTILDMLTLLIGFYANYIQGVVLSPLTGILTAIYVRNQVEARLIAPAIFLALQIGSYALTFLIAFNLIPGIYQHFFLTNSAVHMTLPFAQLALFCGIREAIFLSVWLLVKQELNVHPSEFNRLISLPH